MLEPVKMKDKEEKREMEGKEEVGDAEAHI